MSVDLADRDLARLSGTRIARVQGMIGENGASGGPDADGFPFLEGGVERFQVVGAADEVGVAGERHDERNRARRGPLPSPRRA